MLGRHDSGFFLIIIIIFILFLVKLPLCNDAETGGWVGVGCLKECYRMNFDLARRGVDPGVGKTATTKPNEREKTSPFSLETVCRFFSPGEI